MQGLYSLLLAGLQDMTLVAARNLLEPFWKMAATAIAMCISTDAATKVTSCIHKPFMLPAPSYSGVCLCMRMSVQSKARHI